MMDDIPENAPSSDRLDDGLSLLLPHGHLHVLGLLMRDTGQAPDALVDWYETIHAVNVRDIWPHMTRYARNYIVAVEEGPPPPYRVLTEFDWRSEEDKVRARELFLSPAVMAATASEYAGTPPAWLQDIYSILVPVTPVRAAGTALPTDIAGPVRRRALLLRRLDPVPQPRFEGAARQLAEAITALAPGAGVVIDFCHGPRTAAEEPDAVLFVHGADGLTLPRPDATACALINIFAVEMRKSPI